MGFENLIGPVNRALSASIGTPATWTPNGTGSPVSFRAIFRREHRTFDGETGLQVATTQSSAWITAADLPRTPIEDDRITLGAAIDGLDGTEFLVAGIEPDGLGGILLVLEKAPE